MNTKTFCDFLRAFRFAAVLLSLSALAPAVSAETPEFRPRVVIPKPFPAIQEVPVVTAAEADRRLAEQELVIGVVVNGKARAYPINMLTGPRREIINDSLGGQAIAATWWHLCHNGIVYAAEVKDRRLTFVVSGMLWQRSLVMMDLETRSLWSHLLGRAMRGPLQGTELDAIPSVMTDWNTWRSQHPESTVLNLSRTSREYRREFYRDRSQFVIGMADGTARAWPFDELARQSIVNDQFNDDPVLVVFLDNSATALIYARRLGDRTLSFANENDKLVDRETGSQWDGASGKAVGGPLTGESLRRKAGVVSYRRAWEKFHPRSEYWRANEK